MTDESPLLEQIGDDPEVVALLDFTPVPRKCDRSDGWSPEVQRGFVRVLRGSPWQAANDVGRTKSGAYQVRISAGGESFATAWDGALALYHRRNPRPLPKGRPSRGEILSGAGRAPWPEREPEPPPGWVDPAQYDLTLEEFADGILHEYRLKLQQERTARLDGRIIEADFYVRQLTWLEVALDLGGNAAELLLKLKRGDMPVIESSPRR